MYGCFVRSTLRVMNDTTSERGRKLVEENNKCISTLARWFQESQVKLQTEDLSAEERDCYQRFERLEQLSNILVRYIQNLEEAKRNLEPFSLTRAKERGQFLELRLEEVSQLIKWHDKLVSDEAETTINQLKLGKRLREDLVRVGQAKEENYVTLVNYETDDELRNQHKNDDFLMMLGLSFARDELKEYSAKLEQRILAENRSN
jgi:hypothetical protein